MTDRKTVFYKLFCVCRFFLRQKFFLFFFASVFVTIESFSQSAIDSVGIDTSKSISVTTQPSGDTSLNLAKKKSRFTEGSTSLQKNDATHSLVGPTMHPPKKFYWNSAKALNDSTISGDKKLRRHNPLYASLFSMALPGLGQAYNRKYWKIPIIYAGIGGFSYGIYALSKDFTGYRNAYRLQVDEDPNTYGSYKGVDDDATLKTYRDYYKRNRDLVCIFTGVWYALNIIDAAVDAHLFEWNMKDDIHLSWQPSVVSPLSNYSQVAVGARIGLSF